MKIDAAAGPDRMGVRYLALIASSHLRLSPEISGLQIITDVVKKLDAREFSITLSHLLPDDNLISIGKDEGRLRLIAIGSVMRRFVASSHCRRQIKNPWTLWLSYKSYAASRQVSTPSCTMCDNRWKNMVVMIQSSSCRLMRRISSTARRAKKFSPPPSRTQPLSLASLMHCTRGALRIYDLETDFCAARKARSKDILLIRFCSP